MSKTEHQPDLYEGAAADLRALGLPDHVADAIGLSLAVADASEDNLKNVVLSVAELLRPEQQNQHSKRRILANLGDLGLPVKRLAADLKQVEVWNFRFQDFTGFELLTLAAERLAALLGGAPFRVGEPVVIVQPYLEAGAQGRVKSVKMTPGGYVYKVHLNGTSATRLRELPAVQLLSLEAPQTNAQGYYFTPLYLTPERNEVALCYPDQCAPDEEGALAAGQRFRDTLRGIFALFNGLRPLDRCAMVNPKGTYCTARLKLGNEFYKVVVLGGPAYELWKENELREGAPPVPDVPLKHHASNLLKMRPTLRRRTP